MTFTETTWSLGASLSRFAKVGGLKVE